MDICFIIALNAFWHRGEEAKRWINSMIHKKIGIHFHTTNTTVVINVTVSHNKHTPRLHSAL